MCFNQRGDISTLNGSSLKLVDKFTYLGSSVSSTETDINTRLAKTWTAIDRLSVIWKSYRPSRKLSKLDEQESKDELIRDVHLWIPSHGRAKAGRPARTIEKGDGRGSGICVLMARHDDDEYQKMKNIYSLETTKHFYGEQPHLRCIIIEFRGKVLT